MNRDRNVAVAISLAVILGLTGSVAHARETFHDFEVRVAVESKLGRERLLGVPFYMAGQKHREIAMDLGRATSNKRTNAFNKSDERACQIAFLSAIIAFQQRVNRMGGDAVVDLRSITKHNNLESPTKYRCVAGNIIANVALTGRVVKLH